MDKHGWHTLKFWCTQKKHLFEICTKQYNQKDEFQKFANAFQFNDSFVPVYCLQIFQSVEW